ncbi:unnamed protein product, partial [Symbiodinium pilosum]
MLRDRFGGDLSSIPLAKDKLTGPAIPSSAASEAPASALPGPSKADMDAEQEEAFQLGLSTKEPAAAAKTRKRKRTPQETIKEEMEKLGTELETLIQGLDQVLTSKTFGQDVGKLDRALQKKAKETAELHMYQEQEIVKKRQAKLEALRLAAKAAKSYCSVIASATKKQALQGDFLARMGELMKEIPD